jgi:hypothetical protein
VSLAHHQCWVPELAFPRTAVGRGTVRLYLVADDAVADASRRLCGAAESVFIFRKEPKSTLIGNFRVLFDGKEVKNEVSSDCEVFFSKNAKSAARKNVADFVLL